MECASFIVADNYSAVSTFSVWRPLKPPLGMVTYVTRVYSLCTCKKIVKWEKNLGFEIVMKCYRTESSSSFRSLASLTLILSIDILLPPCHRLG